MGGGGGKKKKEGESFLDVIKYNIYENNQKNTTKKTHQI